jgi:hypothetical protein
LVESERQQRIWLKRFASWISKATRAQVHVRVRAPTPTPTHAGAHKHALAHTRSCPHTHTLHTGICHNYLFHTTTMVTWTRLKVTLYVHCFYSYFYVWVMLFVFYFNPFEAPLLCQYQTSAPKTQPQCVRCGGLTSKSWRTQQPWIWDIDTSAYLQNYSMLRYT